MSDGAALVYLEADDEITTAVRRLRAADPGRVIVIAPGRSRATSSAVALRLLARTAVDAGREVVVVGDALTRSLAADAGLPAYASVDDARNANPAAGPIEPASEAQPPAPRHAAIHVVRGVRSDDTAPTMAAIAAAPAAEVGDETRPVPAVRRATSTPRLSPRRRGRSASLAALLAVVAVLLVVGIVAGATLLPAATITVVPRNEPVSAAYEIVAEADHRSGTVEATATVVATGEYEIVESATGVVTFFNFNVGAVEVPEGALVAAGEQAFATTEAVTVPSGSLTEDGRIRAGEADAPVIAAAPGPDANVAVDAIDTVLSEGTAARLRGFPQNSSRLARNAEPTTGGVDARGARITEADVAAAVEELESELVRRADEARPRNDDLLVVGPRAAEPALDLPEDLVGTRDQPEVDISGTLAWEAFLVDPDDIEREAAQRLVDDPIVPASQELLPDATEVTLGEPRLDGDAVIVPASVSGRAASRVDVDDVLARSLGRTAEEARVALAELGEAEVILWPRWVASVPELEWRVEVRIAEREP